MSYFKNTLAFSVHLDISASYYKYHLRTLSLVRMDTTLWPNQSGLFSFVSILSLHSQNTNMPYHSPLAYFLRSRYITKIFYRILPTASGVCEFNQPFIHMSGLNLYLTRPPLNEIV